MNIKAPERTHQLLEAAAACFVRRGFHRTTMDDIAREAGVSAGLIYRHFASKDDLIVAMVEQYQRDELARIIAAAQAPTLAAALAHLFSPEGRAADWRAEGLILAEIIAEALRNQRIEAVVRSNELAVIDALVTLISAAQARGEADPTLDPVVTAEFLKALSDGLLLRLAFASPHEHAELDYSRTTLDLLYRRLLGSSV
jgi:AcrR family transcriptional regulator